VRRRPAAAASAFQRGCGRQLLQSALRRRAEEWPAAAGALEGGVRRGHRLALLQLVGPLLLHCLRLLLSRLVVGLRLL
jgi:hypothetical protein